MTKLNQILAIDKGVRKRTYDELTRLDKDMQKPALFSGISRTYQPIDDDGDQLPPERQLVQRNVDDVLTDVVKFSTEAFNVTAEKEWANTTAKADIVVDGTTLMSGVPPTFLLFLEKQLVDVRTMIGRAPVLDPAEKWTWDDHADAYATEPIQTHRSQKVPKVIVKYDATPEHPAQTELFAQDVTAGYWTTIKFSGALPAVTRAAMLERIEKLLDAVKSAREAANDMTITDSPDTAPLLAFVFPDQS